MPHASIRRQRIIASSPTIYANIFTGLITARPMSATTPPSPRTLSAMSSIPGGRWGSDGDDGADVPPSLHEMHRLLGWSATDKQRKAAHRRRRRQLRRDAARKQQWGAEAGMSVAYRTAASSVDGSMPSLPSAVQLPYADNPRAKSSNGRRRFLGGSPIRPSKRLLHSASAPAAEFRQLQATEDLLAQHMRGSAAAAGAQPTGSVWRARTPGAVVAASMAMEDAGVDYDGDGYVLHGDNRRADSKPRRIRQPAVLPPMSTHSLRSPPRGTRSLQSSSQSMRVRNERAQKAVRLSPDARSAKERARLHNAAVSNPARPYTRSWLPPARPRRDSWPRPGLVAKRIKQLGHLEFVLAQRAKLRALVRVCSATPSIGTRRAADMWFADCRPTPRQHLSKSATFSCCIMLNMKLPFDTESGASGNGTSSVLQKPLVGPRMMGLRRKMVWLLDHTPRHRREWHNQVLSQILLPALHLHLLWQLFRHGGIETRSAVNRVASLRPRWQPLAMLPMCPPRPLLVVAPPHGRRQWEKRV